MTDNITWGSVALGFLGFVFTLLMGFMAWKFVSKFLEIISKVTGNVFGKAGVAFGGGVKATVNKAASGAKEVASDAYQRAATAAENGYRGFHGHARKNFGDLDEVARKDPARRSFTTREGMEKLNQEVRNKFGISTNAGNLKELQETLIKQRRFDALGHLAKEHSGVFDVYKLQQETIQHGSKKDLLDLASVAGIEAAKIEKALIKHHGVEKNGEAIQAFRAEVEKTSAEEKMRQEIVVEDIEAELEELFDIDPTDEVRVDHLQEKLLEGGHFQALAYATAQRPFLFSAEKLQRAVLEAGEEAKREDLLALAKVKGIDHELVKKTLIAEHNLGIYSQEIMDYIDTAKQHKEVVLEGDGGGRAERMT